MKLRIQSKYLHNSIYAKLKLARENLTKSDLFSGYKASSSSLHFALILSSTYRATESDRFSAVLTKKTKDIPKDLQSKVKDLAIRNLQGSVEHSSGEEGNKTKPTSTNNGLILVSTEELQKIVQEAVQNALVVAATTSANVTITNNQGDSQNDRTSIRDDE
jgi:hypothetical protein